jgi:AAA lid domain
VNAGYVISSETAKELAAALQEVHSRDGVEGNGRFSHNLVQEAMQNQAIRLMAIPHERWSQEMLMELIWEDFQPFLA